MLEDVHQVVKEILQVVEDVAQFHEKVIRVCGGSAGTCRGLTDS